MIKTIYASFKTLSLALCLLLPLYANAGSKEAQNQKVLMKTSVGNIIIELYPKKAPVTVANFLQYIDDGFFDGTVIHRIVPGFVIQGGGFTFDYQRKKTRDPIKNESDNGLKNLRGTLSMARTSNPDSATSQFFINTQDNEALDKTKNRAGYAVFGKVIEGYDIVKKIENAPRGLNPSYPEAPNFVIQIEKVSRM